MTRQLRAALIAAVGSLQVIACGSESGVQATTSAPEPASRGHETRPAPEQAVAAPGTPPRAPTEEPTASPSAPEDDASGAPYPIVLAHGMAGFTRLKHLPVDYFRGVRDDLAAHGERDVFVTVVPPFDASEVRATALAAQIDGILASTGKRKVNLVAHSQGGIDARVVASPAGLALGHRVASVTTVSTPHRGSRVADVTLAALAGGSPDVIDGMTRGVLELLQMTFYEAKSDPKLHAQLVNLSEAYMTGEFNVRFVDDPAVRYFSYAGRSSDDGRRHCDTAIFPNDPRRVDIPQVFLQPLVALLAGTTNLANDGLVTVPSARWGTFVQCIPADHFKEVGQVGMTRPDPVSGFDPPALYRDIVARLRADGL